MNKRWKEIKEALVGKKQEEMSLHDVIEEHYHPPLLVEVKEFFRDMLMVMVILGIICIPLVVGWLLGVIG